MKFSILFIIALSVGSFCFAQSSKNLTSQFDQHKRALSYLLQQSQGSTVALKTTYVKERVKAQSTYYSTGASSSLVDSLNLSYSGKRGSQYDYNLMFYPYNYQYNTTPLFTYLGNFTKPQVLYDTLLRWTVDPNNVLFGFYEEIFSKYDTVKNTLLNSTNLFVDSNIDQNMSFANVFDTTGNITAGYWFNLKHGVKDSVYKQVFSYNILHKLIADSIYQYKSGSWSLMVHSLYKYDASGNAIQIDMYEDTALMIEQLKYVNTYDTANRLQTVLTSFNDGVALVQYLKDSFTYSPGISYNTSWKEYQYDGINHYWLGYTYTSKHINASGLPDTVYIHQWDTTKTWSPQAKDVVTYDSLNNPVRILEYDFDTTKYSDTATITTNYYYEQLNIENAGVSSLAATDFIKIYPNPANDVLVISQADNPNNGILSASMINVNGQILKNFYLPNQSRIFQFSISDLTPGTYWMIIRNQSREVLHKQMIVKL
ncbi:MAG TPA: T9SS type A sorting domain-containing protein [Flavipsychrobacter sp.]|nr:T9SS type A sorting domain-containing protein [Flavipsychrobacter sp.]